MKDRLSVWHIFGKIWAGSKRSKIVLCSALALAQAVSLLAPVMAQQAPPRNLDLASQTANVAAAGNGVITVAGQSKSISAGMSITPAEAVALAQVLHRPGGQAITIGAGGNAIGGTLNLSYAAHNGASILNIPTGVTALVNVAQLPNLNVSQALTNAGTLQFFTSNACANLAAISAHNVSNLHGALISSVLPSNLAAYGPVNVAIHMNISAVQSIVNQGSILSSGNLNLNAASIINGAANNANASMQTAGNLNLSGNLIQNFGLIGANQNININSSVAALANAQLINSGLVRSLSGDIISSICNVSNSGLIASQAGNISFVSPTSLLSINNTNGAISATKLLSFETASVPSIKGQLKVSGGDISGKGISLSSPNGVIEMDVHSASGPLSVSGGCASIFVSSGTLQIAKLSLSGDPIIANSNGDVNLPSNLVFNGQDLAVLASGNITEGSNSSQNTIDLSDAGTGSGGNLTMVAGYDFTPATAGQQTFPDTTPATTYTITGPSTSGGSILLGDVNINTSSATGKGGSVTLIAHQGNSALTPSPNNGVITITSNTAASVINTSGGFGPGGDVTIIASAANHTGTNVNGTVNTPNGPFTAIAGAISLNGLQITTDGNGGAPGAVRIFACDPQMVGVVSFSNGTMNGGFAPALDAAGKVILANTPFYWGTWGTLNSTGWLAGNIDSPTIISSTASGKDAGGGIFMQGRNVNVAELANNPQTNFSDPPSLTTTGDVKIYGIDSVVVTSNPMLVNANFQALRITAGGAGVLPGTVMITSDGTINLGGGGLLTGNPGGFKTETYLNSNDKDIIIKAPQVSSKNGLWEASGGNIRVFASSGDLDVGTYLFLSASSDPILGKGALSGGIELGAGVAFADNLSSLLQNKVTVLPPTQAGSGKSLILPTVNNASLVPNLGGAGAWNAVVYNNKGGGINIANSAKLDQQGNGAIVFTTANGFTIKGTDLSLVTSAEANTSPLSPASSNPTNTNTSSAAADTMLTPSGTVQNGVASFSSGISAGGTVTQADKLSMSSFLNSNAVQITSGSSNASNFSLVAGNSNNQTAAHAPVAPPYPQDPPSQNLPVADPYKAAPYDMVYAHADSIQVPKNGFAQTTILHYAGFGYDQSKGWDPNDPRNFSPLINTKNYSDMQELNSAAISKDSLTSVHTGEEFNLWVKNAGLADGVFTYESKIVVGGAPKTFPSEVGIIVYANTFLPLFAKVTGEVVSNIDSKYTDPNQLKSQISSLDSQMQKIDHQKAEQALQFANQMKGMTEAENNLAKQADSLKSQAQKLTDLLKSPDATVDQINSALNEQLKTIAISQNNLSDALNQMQLPLPIVPQEWWDALNSMKKSLEDLQKDPAADPDKVKNLQSQIDQQSKQIEQFQLQMSQQQQQRDKQIPIIKAALQSLNDQSKELQAQYQNLDKQVLAERQSQIREALSRIQSAQNSIVQAEQKLNTQRTDLIKQFLDNQNNFDQTKASLAQQRDDDQVKLDKLQKSVSADQVSQIKTDLDYLVSVLKNPPSYYYDHTYKRLDGVSVSNPYTMELKAPPGQSFGGFVSATHTIAMFRKEHPTDSYSLASGTKTFTSDMYQSQTVDFGAFFHQFKDLLPADLGALPSELLAEYMQVMKLANAQPPAPNAPPQQLQTADNLSKLKNLPMPADIQNMLNSDDDGKRVAAIDYLNSAAKAAGFANIENLAALLGDSGKYDGLSDSLRSQMLDFAQITGNNQFGKELIPQTRLNRDNQIAAKLNSMGVDTAQMNSDSPRMQFQQMLRFEGKLNNVVVSVDGEGIPIQFQNPDDAYQKLVLSDDYLKLVEYRVSGAYDPKLVLPTDTPAQRDAKIQTAMNNYQQAQDLVKDGVTQQNWQKINSASVVLGLISSKGDTTAFPQLADKTFMSALSTASLTDQQIADLSAAMPNLMLANQKTIATDILRIRDNLNGGLEAAKKEANANAGLYAKGGWLLDNTLGRLTTGPTTSSAVGWMNALIEDRYGTAQDALRRTANTVNNLNPIPLNPDYYVATVVQNYNQALGLNMQAYDLTQKYTYVQNVANNNYTEIGKQTADASLMVASMGAGGYVNSALESTVGLLPRVGASMIAAGETRAVLGGLGTAADNYVSTGQLNGAQIAQSISGNFMQGALDQLAGSVSGGLVGGIQGTAAKSMPGFMSDLNFFLGKAPQELLNAGLYSASSEVLGRSFTGLTGYQFQGIDYSKNALQGITDSVTSNLQNVALLSAFHAPGFQIPSISGSGSSLRSIDTSTGKSLVAPDGTVVAKLYEPVSLERARSNAANTQEQPLRLVNTPQLSGLIGPDGSVIAKIYSKEQAQALNSYEPLSIDASRAVIAQVEPPLLGLTAQPPVGTNLGSNLSPELERLTRQINDVSQQLGGVPAADVQKQQALSSQKRELEINLAVASLESEHRAISDTLAKSSVTAEQGAQLNARQQEIEKTMQTYKEVTGRLAEIDNQIAKTTDPVAKGELSDLRRSIDIGRQVTVGILPEIEGPGSFRLRDVGEPMNKAVVGRESLTGPQDNLPFRANDSGVSLALVEKYLDVLAASGNKPTSLTVGTVENQANATHNFMTGEVTVSNNQQLALPVADTNSVLSAFNVKHENTHNLQVAYFDKLPAETKQSVLSTFKSIFENLDYSTKNALYKKLGILNNRAALSDFLAGKYVSNDVSLNAYFLCFPELFAEMGAIYDYSKTAQGKDLTFSQLVEASTRNIDPRRSEALLSKDFAGGIEDLYNTLVNKVFSKFDAIDSRQALAQVLEQAPATSSGGILRSILSWFSGPPQSIDAFNQKTGLNLQQSDIEKISQLSPQQLSQLSSQLSAVENNLGRAPSAQRVQQAIADRTNIIRQFLAGDPSSTTASTNSALQSSLGIPHKSSSGPDAKAQDDPFASLARLGILKGDSPASSAQPLMQNSAPSMETLGSDLNIHGRNASDQLAAIAQNNVIVGIGEKHGLAGVEAASVRNFLADNVKVFKDAGFSQLALEIPTEKQSYLDGINSKVANKQTVTKADIEFAVSGLADSFKTPEFKNLIDSFAQNGFQFHAVDGPKDSLRDQKMAQSLLGLVGTGEEGKTLFLVGANHLENGRVPSLVSDKVPIATLVGVDSGQPASYVKQPTVVETNKVQAFGKYSADYVNGGMLDRITPGQEFNYALILPSSSQSPNP